MNPPPMPTGLGAVRRTENWYDRNIDGGFVPLVPSQVTTATVAQQIGAHGEQLPDHEEVSTAQTWYAPDAEVGRIPLLNGAAPTPFGQGLDSDYQQEISDNQAVWFVPDLPDEGPFPIVVSTTATVPQQAGLWQEGEQQQQWLPSVWFPVADLLGVAEFDQFDPSAGFDWTEQPQVWSETRWVMPEPAADNQNVLNPPTTATVAQQAAVQSDASGQQDVEARIRWFHPGELVEGPLRASRYVYPVGATGDPAGSYSKAVQASSPQVYFRFEAPFGAAPGQLPGGWYTTFDVLNFAGAGAELGSRGQWFGSPSTLTPGLITGDSDSAVILDGLDWMVVKSGDWAFNPTTGDFSVEFWLQTTTPNAYIMSRGTVATGWWVSIDTLGRPTFVVAGTGMTSPRVVTDGLIHHIVWTRSAAGQFTCYVDGTRQGTAALGVLDATASGQFVIGWLADLTGNRFNGTLDELAFYNTVLTLAEVTTHYIVGTQGWIPMAQGADPSEQLANDQRWLLPDVPGDAVQVPSLVTTATVAQQAALWQDQSGQQDRSVQATWFEPILVISDAPVAAILTTVAGVPTILIDAEDGTVYVYIGGNFILVASPKAG